MKTFNQWIELVIDPVLKERILSNIDHSRLNEGIANMRMVILSFSWVNTIQGFDYWSTIYEKMVYGENIHEAIS